MTGRQVWTSDNQYWFDVSDLVAEPIRVYRFGTKYVGEIPAGLGESQGTLRHSVATLVLTVEQLRKEVGALKGEPEFELVALNLAGTHGVMAVTQEINRRGWQDYFVQFIFGPTDSWAVLRLPKHAAKAWREEIPW